MRGSEELSAFELELYAGEQDRVCSWMAEEANKEARPGDLAWIIDVSLVVSYSLISKSI